MAVVNGLLVLTQISANSSVIAAGPGASSGMSHLLQFLVLLALIVLVAKAAGFLSTKFGQPAVLGELLAGVVLGPTVLNLFGLPFITAEGLEGEFTNLAQIGVILLMFMAGLETDLKALIRVGKVAVLAGWLGVVFPVIMGAAVALPFNFTITQALFIGIVLSATSVSISAQTLLELGVLKRKEGMALLGAAVIDDVLVILGLSLFVALAVGGGTGGAADIALVIGRMALFFAITVFLGVKLLPWLLKRVGKLPISEGLTATMLVCVLGVAWAAEFLGGLALIVGAFMVGVMTARTPYKVQLEKSFHTLTYALFVPVFFVSIGLAANFGQLSVSDLGFALAIVVVAVVSKVLDSGIGARLGGFSNGEAFRIGLGMVSRGEVGLIVAGVGLSEGLIGSNTYSIMVLMVLATTIITPLSLKLAYCKPKEEAGAAPSGAVLVKTTSTNSEMEEASHGKDARGFRNAVKRKPTLPE